MKYEIDINNIKVTNAIASVINGAFETGINPAWFEVKSLSKGGFLDAAFAGPECGETASGKPAIKDWVVEGRLNCEGYKSKWTKVTPALAVDEWVKYVETTKDKFLPTKVDAYLRYLDYLSKPDHDEERLDNILMQEYEPDGVHDDAMAQIVFSNGEGVVFG
jgi:hypothetical protein